MITLACSTHDATGMPLQRIFAFHDGGKPMNLFLWRLFIYKINISFFFFTLLMDRIRHEMHVPSWMALKHCYSANRVRLPLSRRAFRLDSTLECWTICRFAAQWVQRRTFAYSNQAHDNVHFVTVFHQHIHHSKISFCCEIERRKERRKKDLLLICNISLHYYHEVDFERFQTIEFSNSLQHVLFCLKKEERFYFLKNRKERKGFTLFS